MTFHESDDDLNQLICTLETIDVGRLKRTSYKKYIDQLYEVTRQSLLADGARLNIIIQHIKTNKGPCFQRDVIIDLIARLVSVDLQAILKKPLARSSSAQWNTLACGIATLPDMIANCNAVEKYPHMEKETFYNQLVEQVYESLEYRSSVTCTVETEYKLFLLKLLGRVAIAGYNLIVWDKFTRRAIYEPRGDVKQFCADVLRLSMKPPAELTALELFIDHLCLPIFSNLKPGRDTGRLITSILATSVLDNEHLRYLICDKSIFRTNYHLTKEKQAIVLFNISSYLASLVTAQQQQSHDNAKDDRMSLILETLLEIVQTWTSPTKILLRTYQQSKYITCAMLVFFRFALQSDGTQLASNANKIQTMIVNAIPIYLNRASHEQRNLACCLCQLILPKLRDILLSKQANVAKSGENEELKLDFKVDLDDELLYLQRLFDLDVGLLFQDVSDTSIEANNKTTTTSNKLPEIPASAATTSDHVVNDNQVDRHRSGDKQRKSNELNVDGDDNSTTTCCSASNGKVVVDLINRKCSGQGSKVAIDDCHDDDGDDLVPYILSEDEDDDPDGDEFEIGDDATCVPIYLRDCINGLIENNNHRYVRLCLIKVNALINEMIGQQDDADARIESTSVCLAARPGKPSVSWLSTHKDEPDDRLISSRHDHVSSTVNDVGVELARTLLFMENQFGIEKFDEYRMNALVSLCYAAPGLVGKYLISELNGTNRSMRQQLDILNILVCTSHRLAFGSSATMPSEGNMETLANRSQQLIVSSKRTKKAINRFAPYASLFFYGISHRLKADFLDAKSLVISQPQSVMSAFREHQTNDCKTNGARPLDIILKATQQPNATAKIRDTRPSSNATSKSVIVLEDDEDDDWDKKTTTKTDRSLERDSLSDDSYLLSRILMSISNILSCSARQPVTCKLSSDLLDILAAYRCHPDSGVQRGIMSCLKMIRDCTPSTYYNDYIEKRMLRSFGPWLARNESNIQR